MSEVPLNWTKTKSKLILSLGNHFVDFLCEMKCSLVLLKMSQQMQTMTHQDHALTEVDQKL